MSTLDKPRIPLGSEPSRDDDLTGVRALLSSLPEPDPMPEHLVKRINASLAAEQAQRAARMSGASVTPMSPVTPMLPTASRRGPRLLFAMASAAAAVTLFAVVGSNVLNSGQPTTTAGRSAVASTSGAEDAAGSPQKKSATDELSAASRAASPALVQIGLSGTRYTQAGFVTQARTLHRAPAPEAGLQFSKPPGVAGTPPGLKECLAAIGAGDAQTARADIASYEGQPAVIIVVTTKGTPVAYVVLPTCSHAAAGVLRPATPLP